MAFHFRLLSDGIARCTDFSQPARSTSLPSSVAPILLFARSCGSWLGRHDGRTAYRSRAQKFQNVWKIHGETQ